MSKKPQSIQTRLVQLGWLPVILFLALQVISRAPAQRNARNQSRVGGATPFRVACSEANDLAGTLPIENCDGGPLWDQYNNAATAPPVSIGSQMFEPAMAVFDDEAADDFVIGNGWGAPYIMGVRVMGESLLAAGPHRRSILTFTKTVQVIFRARSSQHSWICRTSERRLTS